MDTNDDLLTIGDIIDIVRVTRRKIYRWIATKRFTRCEDWENNQDKPCGF